MLEAAQYKFGFDPDAAAKNVQPPTSADPSGTAAAGDAEADDRLYRLFAANLELWDAFVEIHGSNEVHTEVVQKTFALNLPVDASFATSPKPLGLSATTAPVLTRAEAQRQQQQQQPAQSAAAGACGVTAADLSDLRPIPGKIVFRFEWKNYATNRHFGIEHLETSFRVLLPPSSANHHGQQEQEQSASQANSEELSSSSSAAAAAPWLEVFSCNEESKREAPVDLEALERLRSCVEQGAFLCFL